MKSTHTWRIRVRYDILPAREPVCKWRAEEENTYRMMTSAVWFAYEFQLNFDVKTD